MKLVIEKYIMCSIFLLNIILIYDYKWNFM
uniref:Uncharacterized protein n=1 Tax=viral metagenome TaxID=1070528 RepID=A0A6C0LR42_9ZZZZ